MTPLQISAPPQARPPHPRTFSLRTFAAALMLAGAIVSPAQAQSEPADLDDDGVADAIDACPATEPADLAGPDGCTIVSCEDGPGGTGWSSHRAYVDYVVAWVKGAKATGTIDGGQARTLVRRARRSTCGNVELVRCCVFAPFDSDVGQCRIMRESACEALDDRLFDDDGEADVEDAGSCLPNPCVF